MELLSDKRLLATISAFSLLTIGAGIAKKMLGERTCCRNGERDEADMKAQQATISRELNKLQGLQGILARRAQEMEVARRGHSGILAPDTLKEIFEFAATTVDAEEVQEVFENNRKARRSLWEGVREGLGESMRDQIEVYFRFACTFEEQIQYLIERAQKDFIVFLGLEYSTIIESVNYHQSCPGSFKTWLDEWSTQVKEQLRQKLTLYSQHLQPERVQQVIKGQIQCLGTVGPRFVQAVRELGLEGEEEQEGVPVFLQLYLQDQVWSQFGVEIEQVNLAPQDITSELEDKLHVLAEMQRDILSEIQDLSQNSMQHLDNSDRQDLR